MAGLMFLAFLAVSLACAFYGVKLMVWTGSLIAVWVLFAASAAVSWPILLLSAGLLAAILVPLNYRPLRLQLLSAPFLKQYLRMTPTLSETEQVALEAGTVGWEGELFAGNPDWKKLQALQA